MTGVSASGKLTVLNEVDLDGGDEGGDESVLSEAEDELIFVGEA